MLQNDESGRILSSPEISIGFGSNASFISRKSVRVLDDSKRKHRTTVGRKLTTHSYTLNGRLIRGPMISERIYQPTYRLEPIRLLDIDRIKLMIENIATAYIESKEMDLYEPKRAMKACEEISNDIRFRLQFLQFKRFRIVVLTNIIENQLQDFSWKMAFLWEKQFDQWTKYEYKTKTFVLSVIVLCVYCE